MSGDFFLAGIIGHPVSHSLSPLLHAFWLHQHGIAGVYVPLAVAPEGFSAAVDNAVRSRFRGLNVTVPYKQSACALADILDDSTRLTGAANLLVFRRGQIAAQNTDVVGLTASLTEDFGADVGRGQIVIVLGAGGAARAAVLASARLGAREIRILSRDKARAEALAEQLSPVGTALIPLAWEQWPSAARDASLLVNATTGGMRGMPSLNRSLDCLQAEAAVYDLVYNPLETELLKQARERGHPAAGGLGMLIHQAVPAFEAFYGVAPADLRGARTALEKALSS